MIEFGAGGTIVHNESETTPAPDSATPEGAATEGTTEGAATTGADGAPASPTPAPVPAIPTIQANPRRKRKAKGWFCPVCRQRKLLGFFSFSPPPEA